jgi:hypothetical protein
MSAELWVGSLRLADHHRVSLIRQATAQIVFGDILSERIGVGFEKGRGY